MFFVPAAFVGVCLLQSGIGQIVAVSYIGGKALASSMYKKKLEVVENLQRVGLNPDREEQVRTKLELGTIVYSADTFPVGMKHWAGDYLLTEFEDGQLSNAMEAKLEELRTGKCVGMPEAVRVDLMDLSRLRRSDQMTQKWLAKTSAK